MDSSQCFWADDSETGGHSIRRTSIRRGPTAPALPRVLERRYDRGSAASHHNNQMRFNGLLPSRIKQTLDANVLRRRSPLEPSHGAN